MKTSRRNLLRGCSAAFLLASVPLNRLWAAEGDVTPRRFVHVFLEGGWDSALATDPVIGSKANSAAYEPIYASMETAAVAGKPQLIVGPGLSPAVQAFADVNCAFVNGMSVEVTAHEVAAHYLLTGVLSLSRTRESPALAALMGRGGASFPPHVVLGMEIPLGETGATAPPLHATAVPSLTGMLAGPRGGDWPMSETAIPAADGLILSLDQGFLAGRPAGVGKAMQSWTGATDKLAGLYDQRFDLSMALTDDDLARYGTDEVFGDPALFAAAWKTLATGLSPYVSVQVGGFDTHTGHLPEHDTTMRATATALAALLQDLRNTPDPAAPGKALIETTTVLVSSEFVRTPLFNAGQGTDHWHSASAILLGAGVKDGVVIGATDDQANPLGWDSGKAAPFTTKTALMPEHLAATVLAGLGFDADADTIGKERIDALFG